MPSSKGAGIASVETAFFVISFASCFPLPPDWQLARSYLLSRIGISDAIALGFGTSGGGA